ncbi:Serine/threonine protein kinase [Parasponia andersonii]|uniref:cyclin-dependent kinase n=1 Tax=Parasponia andersonii TaxID=3476 RepID=A0A2P5DVQ5_PARAD|nr:Serine/threonine protein kinase [Parasponia andersonii]
MAAGGVDVLRRRDFRVSKEEFDSGKDGSRVVHRHGGGHRNGANSGSRQNGFYGSTTEERERRRTGFSKQLVSCSENGEASRLEDVVWLSSEKKRKFSPIIWDREEKDKKFSFKKRVVPITPLSHPHRSVPKSFSQLGNVSESRVSDSDNQFQGVEIPTEVEAAAADGFVEPSLLNDSGNFSPDELELYGVHQTEDGIKEDDIIEARDISTSRWASEGDFPQRGFRDDLTPDRGSSSPESGEFKRETSGDGARMSRSDDEEGFFVGSVSGSRSSEKELSEDFMDSDDKYCRGAENDLVSVGSDDEGELLQIEESTVSTSQRVNMLHSSRSVFEYEKLNKINEGTYGVVYKARDKKSGEIVGLKKVKMNVNKGEDGFPLSSLREINILSSFSHPSVVNVKEVVTDDDDGVYMVMEYMEYDLKGLMETMREPFSISEVKSLMLQLLEGVKYLHDNWVLHRDLKTSNILLNKKGELKICDFGLSRQYGSPLKPYTPLVVTLWYRAPEILLGTKKYSTAIDMWSVGCVMAELVAKEPLFTGKTEVDQLDKIFRTLGTPNEKIWPGLPKLPGSKANFVKNPYNLLRKKFPATSFIGSAVLSDSGFDLLSKLLTYDPEKRITAEAALNHGWFLEAPLPRSDFKPPLPALQGQNRYFSSMQREKYLHL